MHISNLQTEVKMMYALYARQSIDNKESISIESQLEFCHYEAKGKEYRSYKDIGYSGKNTERPGFQQMMEDIRKGEIEAVIVYKLDRISRSILDFSQMMEEFRKRNVEFISVNEKFDTTTIMGRSMLNICVVFAQMERETIQQRVTDAYYSRCKNQFYMGGRVPYGYRLEDYSIMGRKSSRYVEVPEESEQLKLMYSLYADPNNSLGDIVNYFNKHGIRHLRGGMWSTARISEILRSPVYVKADSDIYDFFTAQETNVNNCIEQFIGENGCYLYKGQGSTTNKKSDLKGKELVIAPHKGFIPSDIWLKCRIRCLNNRQSAKTCKGKNSWLVGKVKCGNCKYSLTIAKSNTKAGRYFICGTKLATKGSSCSGTGGTIYAGVLEDYILAQIKEKLKEFEYLSADNKPLENKKLSELKIEISKIETNIEEYIDKILGANPALVSRINKRVEELEKQKRALNEELLKLSHSDVTDNLSVITKHTEQWETLSFEDKQTVVDTLIDVIYIANGIITINWKL